MTTVPAKNTEDKFIRLLLQAQASFSVEGFDRWIPVTELVDKFPVWRERDNRPVPGWIFVTCVEHNAHCRLLIFDMNSEPNWDIQTTRVKLTATGVYRAMSFDEL